MPDFKTRARRSAYLTKALNGVLRSMKPDYNAIPAIESQALEDIIHFCACILIETPENRERLWTAMRDYLPGMVNIILPDMTMPEEPALTVEQEAPAPRPEISALDFLRDDQGRYKPTDDAGESPEEQAEF